MGIGKALKKAWHSTIWKAGRELGKVISPKAKAPKPIAPAEQSDEGALEGASVTLGTERKKKSLIKPTATPTGAGPSETNQSNVGLRI